MKIISKYKDYYDYLSGIYGIDDKVILNRSESCKFKKGIWDHEKITLHICGQLIQVYRLKDDYFYLDELGQFGKKIGPMWGKDRSEYWSIKGRGFQDRLELLHFNTTIIASSVNDELKCPIVWNEGSDRNPKYRKFPLLKDLKMYKLFPAKEMFLMLYNWLSRSEEIPNKQTNKEKIVSHGFDLKSSFRNIK